jgi:zinc protease
MLRLTRWAKIAPQFLTCSLIVAGLSFSLRGAQAATLVSDESIQVQKNLTTTANLSNGIPVVIRDIPGSDILQINVNFGMGLKDLPPGRKALMEWYWDVAPMAGKGYPKEKVFGLTEKYGFQLACGGGIELSTCGLGTLNEYWKDAIPLLASVVKSPILNEKDASVVLDRVKATLRSVPSNPNGYVNEVVNSIFYPKSHPYRLNHDEALKELESLKPKDLLAFQKEIVNAAHMSIVVVSSLPRDQVLKNLEKSFGDIKKANERHVKVVLPEFREDSSYILVDRDVPTAFIKIKMNAPSILDKDAVSALMLYDILSDELGEEIRTKRSLSYAVHSFTIQYSLGIGVISASTSKPKETFEALHAVIQNLKDRTYTDEELEEHKNVFATGHFLSQETHASMATALSHALFYHGDANKYYDLARKLDAVTAEDLKRLARDLLVDPRVGVIFSRKKFDDVWAKDFIAKNRRITAPVEDKKS